MTEKNQYQAFESEMNKLVTSLSAAGHFSQTCSKLVQFGFKKLVLLFPSQSIDLVKWGIIGQ